MYGRAGLESLYLLRCTLREDAMSNQPLKNNEILQADSGSDRLSPSALKPEDALQDAASLEIIQNANKEMLDYFNATFLEKLETIQDLKTRAFEIDIKIDELEKTKDLYAFKSTSRKNVFSPITDDGTDNERNQIIENQMRDLNDVRDSLTNKIRSMELALSDLKHRLAILTDAEEAIRQISDTYAKRTVKSEEKIPDEFEFVEDSVSDNLSSHGYNILMQDAFDKAYLATLIDKNLKDSLIGMNHKMEMLSYLLSTDISRAKLTLQEIMMNSRKTLDSIDDICNKLNCMSDSSKPIWGCLDDFIMTQREAHPEVILDAKVECGDYDINLHPVFTINIFRLLNIFFDNIFKHSHANSIEFKISVTPNAADAYISDNGSGIHSDYLTQSPWYSSLHKAHEIIYLLGGNLEIAGDKQTGTTVRFHFSVH